MSLKKFLFGGGDKREDVYRVEDIGEEGTSEVPKTPAFLEEYPTTETPKKKTSFTHSRDVYTFIDIPHSYRVEGLLNNALPNWLKYLTGETFQPKDLMPCEYRLGVMNFNDTKFWFSFRLKQCATENQRRELDRLFGCQDGNYQLCDAIRLRQMNWYLFSGCGSEHKHLCFMKSTRTMSDVDILKMETMRMVKEKIKDKYSDAVYTISDDCYASFTITEKGTMWEKFVKKYDFESLYTEEKELYDEIVQPIMETAAHRYLKTIEKEMADGVPHSDYDV